MKFERIVCPVCAALLEITEDGVREIEWWEILDWKTMPETFAKLPKSIQKKIRDKDLI